MRNILIYKYRIVILVIVMLGLAACASQTNEAPTPTSRPPTETQEPPTSMPLPLTSTPTQTSSPTLKPTETSTPTATETTSPTPTLTETPTSTSIPQGSASYDVIVKYLVHLGTGGNVGCGDSLVAVGTGQVPTGNVVSDVEKAVNSLFSTGVKYVGDLYNPLYQSTLRVQSIEFKKSTGHMTIYLSGSFTKPKENCDKVRYRAQVWQTVYQFPEVKRATIWANQHLLGDLLVAINK